MYHNRIRRYLPFDEQVESQAPMNTGFVVLPMRLLTPALQQALARQQTIYNLAIKQAQEDLELASLFQPVENDEDWFRP